MTVLGHSTFETESMQTSEEFPRTVEFGQNLASGETLTTVSAKGYNAVSGTEIAGIVKTTNIVTGDKLLSAVQYVLDKTKLTNGVRVKIEFKVTSSAGYDYEADVFTPIKDV